MDKGKSFGKGCISLEEDLKHTREHTVKYLHTNDLRPQTGTHYVKVLSLSRSQSHGPAPSVLAVVARSGPESMCAWRILRSDTLIEDKLSLLALNKFVRCCGSARVS